MFVETSAGVELAEVSRATLDAYIESYREWDRKGNVRISPDPHEMLDATHECAHGWLPHDWKRDCSCWGPPRRYKRPAYAQAKRPAPRPVLTTQEALALMAETPTHPDAPFGFKADGVTPRKRPAPTPETIAKMQATRRGNGHQGQRRRAASPKPALTDSDARALAPEDIIASYLSEIDARIARRIDELVAEDAEVARLRAAYAALEAVR